MIGRSVRSSSAAGDPLDDFDSGRITHQHHDVIRLLYRAPSSRREDLPQPHLLGTEQDGNLCGNPSWYRCQLPDKLCEDWLAGWRTTLAGNVTDRVD